jgi:hypothetical protein
MSSEKRHLSHARQLTLRIPSWKGLGADSEEKHEPAGDIDTAVVDSLKMLDPDRPIGEADKRGCGRIVRFVPEADIALVTPQIVGIYLANPAFAARRVWPRPHRNGGSYRCGSRDWPPYIHIPRAVRLQQSVRNQRLANLT